MIIHSLHRLAMSFVLLCIFISAAIGTEKKLHINNAVSSDDLLERVVSNPLSQQPFELIIELDSTLSASRKTKLLNDFFARLSAQHSAIALNVEGLFLSNNYLKKPPVLQGLFNLKSLSLANNTLKQPPIITHLLHLENLDLSYNRLEQAPDLTEQSHLQYLDLNNNKMRVAPRIAHLSKLKRIDLSANELELPPDFNGLSQLRFINLKHNNLQEAPIVTQLPELVALGLAFNQLKQAPAINGLSQLTIFSLDGNPLQHPVNIPLTANAALKVGVPAELISYEKPPEQPLVQDVQKLPELKQLIKHILVIQELKTKHKDTSSLHGRFALRLPVATPTTPTDAWFKYYNVHFPTQATASEDQSNPVTHAANEYIKTMQRTPGFTKVFAQAIQRERIFAESHFPFYHANDAASEVYLDTIHYAVALGYLLQTGPAGSLKLRIPHKLYQQDLSIAQWFQENFKDKKLADSESHLREALLSTNVSLFGNAGIHQCGTWDLFAQAESVFTTKPMLLVATTIAALFGLSQDDRLCYDLAEKMAAFARLLNHTHSLHQIFISKNSVSKHVLLTKALGTPLLEHEVLSRAQDPHRFPNVRRTLQRYINSFGSLNNANEIQARIRFTPELILNDTDDIIHYTYHIPENIFGQPEVAKARSEVQQVIQNMLIKSLDNPGNGPLTTAKRLRQLIEQADAAISKQEHL